MRLVPPVDTGAACVILQKAFQEARQEVPGIQADYVITGSRPYIEKDDDSNLLLLLKKVCADVTEEEPVIGCFPGYTDTAVIAGTLHNHNCMSYGPGNLEMAHKPDEFVPCEDILRCEEVLTELASRFLYEDQEKGSQK